MTYNKLEFEEKILNTTLFNLDREKEYSAYKKEALKMVENLYCYLVALNSKNEQYGYEITILAQRCIKSFDADKGEFLHYFIRSWKNEQKNIYADESENNTYRGIGITEEKRRNLRKLKKLLKIEDNNISNDVLKKLSEIMDISICEVNELLKLEQIQVVSSIVQTNGDEEIAIIDQYTDDNSIEDELKDFFDIEEAFSKIEKIFIELQERQKPILSDLLTITFCESITTHKINYLSYSFVNKEIIKRFVKNNELPNQNWVATKYKRNKASVSRTLNEFIEKIKKEVKE